LKEFILKNIGDVLPENEINMIKQRIADK